MINPLSPDRPFILFAESASDETSKPMKRDERQPSYSNRRRQYLKRLRLNHDPFTHTTTELEFQSNEQLEKLEESDDDEGSLQPSFLTYFVHPPYDSKTELVEDRDELLIDQLKRPQHSFVYADDGGGKTMLRYMLEAECRFVPEQTLIVSYALGKENTTTSTRPTEAILNEALATDLFVQTIEQFGRQQERLDDGLLAGLIPYWRDSIPHFERKLRRHLELGQPYSGTEISAWWTIWQRIAVRYRPFTPSIVKFVRSILAWPKKQPKSASTLQQGLILAQQLGYKQVFTLLDTVDKDNHDDSYSPVTQTIAAINALDSPIPLYIKAFLPKRLAPIIQKHTSRLTSQPFSAIIRWDKPDSLLQIIENRFRSAGSWINGLDAISSQTIATKVNARLIQYAQGSPRRLLQVVSNLIDAHVQNKEAAENYLLTENDWQAMYQVQIHEASSSKSLPESTMSQGVVENGQRNKNSFEVSKGIIC
jgi:hypothetical protein